MKRLLTFANTHFEALFLFYMWLAASGIAAIIGKPWLAGIGLVTVLPFLVLYVLRVRGTHEDDRIQTK